MTRDKAFEMWAPDGSPWSAWAKAVLFAYLPEEIPETGTPVSPEPGLASQQDTALLIELASARSVEAGLGKLLRAFVQCRSTTPAPVQVRRSRRGPWSTRLPWSMSCRSCGPLLTAPACSRVSRSRSPRLRSFWLMHTAHCGARSLCRLYCSSVQACFSIHSGTHFAGLRRSPSHDLRGHARRYSRIFSYGRLPRDGAYTCFRSRDSLQSGACADPAGTRSRKRGTHL